MFSSSLLVAAAAAAAFVVAAADAADKGFDHSGQHCTDVSTWGPKEEVDEPVTKCNTMMPPIEKKCYSRAIEVCLDVPNVFCEMKTFPVCKTFMDLDLKYEITKMTNDPIPWCPLECTRLKKNVTHVVEDLECANKTKQACTTKWVVDPVSGQKKWAGNTDCRDVTWRVCEKAKKNKVIEVPYTVCGASTDCETTMQAENVTLARKGMRQECTAEAAYTCSATLRKQCKSQTVTECREEKTADLCVKSGVMRRWKQTKNHLVHCYLDDVGVEPGTRFQGDRRLQEAVARDVDLSAGAAAKKLAPPHVAKEDEAGNILPDPLAPGAPLGRLGRQKQF